MPPAASTTERFPTTPRAPRAVRLGAIAIGLLAVALATRTTITSAAWVGRVFPGFLLLDNRVVASIGLSHWAGGTDLYQSQVVEVDGRPVTSTPEIYAMVAGLRPGTAVSYLLRRDGGERVVAVPCERFGVRDWILLFGAYLLNSATYLALGLMVWVLRPRLPLGRALLSFGTSSALWMVTAMDLYGPATFFRLHVVGESLFPAAALHLSLLFPQPHPLARYIWVAYLISGLILVPYELLLYQPHAYTLIHNLATLYLGLAALTFGVRLIHEYWQGRSELARQRIRVMTLGTLAGFALPGAIFLASAATAGGVPVNTGAFTGFLFALALAYAIVKHDLFEIDAMVKRGAYYLLLTGAVGVAYVGAVVLFNLTLPGAITDSAAFPVAFTLAVLVLFNPLRTLLQGVVDRVFFRTSYDGAQVLEAVGAQLASALTREHIATLVRDGVQGAIPNASTRLFSGQTLREVGGDVTVPASLVPALAGGRVLTAFDSAESYPDPDLHERVRDALAGLGAEVAVPMVNRGDVVGLLTAGAKRSGLFYTAGDAAFLRALAHQAATALQNAASYETVVELNARLEQRVVERTAQLEESNRDLGSALQELKHAQVQLVQSEKMASLGRLVAGVAHEINNPVSFIATSVPPLRRRLERAAAEASVPVQAMLREAGDIVDIMARGAERTSAIVKDLRSFSRLGEAARKAVDIHEGLEVSLRLLESRWRERITVHREFGSLPPVECDPGQMNQVFMNVLSNACDAITGTGNIWVSTRRDGDVVEVTIRDDGGGMPADVMGRIFDPFFTTKDVGGGTGLGLAISHGVVTAHGGSIAVESTPGIGTVFRIRLPGGAIVA
ncbi:MAG TPA: ATP-binding protein [Candidatus Binatia bacterium]|jgi:signal transduction histidine kinase|nr:ATP-binding protein [Candidatus Binatia bacterium]